jgi:hypothetical protein
MKTILTTLQLWKTKIYMWYITHKFTVKTMLPAKDEKPKNGVKPITPGKLTSRQKERHFWENFRN